MTYYVFKRDKNNRRVDVCECETQTQAMNTCLSPSGKRERLEFTQDAEYGR